MLRCCLETDTENLEHIVLALLHLNSFKEGEGRRAWKSVPWEIMDSLHRKGYISDPANKNKSVWLTEEGAKLSEELLEKLFAATQRQRNGRIAQYPLYRLPDSPGTCC
jgi:hypothetical protein